VSSPTIVVEELEQRQKRKVKVAESHYACRKKGSGRQSERRVLDCHQKLRIEVDSRQAPLAFPHGQGEKKKKS